jgi:UDP-N-acetylmuramoyl-tripeptide--D-alanyl-D-alanine ligase
VGTDSRSVRAAELFVPLRGPNFDGHDFIREALARGAAGCFIQRGLETKISGIDNPEGFFIKVEDPLYALGELAGFWRSRVPATIVAITGSNGKTTTKEMTARILSGPFKTLQTEGNFNNLIGLPLMLLRLCPDHEVAVLEMGMSEFGEIARLKAIADPRVSAITNIGRAHLEFLGDLDGVARAKGELWTGLKEEDWIAVNVDDAKVVELSASAPCRQKTFGILNDAEFRAEDLRSASGKGIRFSMEMNGRKADVALGVFGRHNVYNALAAAALASASGAETDEILQGLENFQPFSGRGEIVRLQGHVHILNDTYNANPDSLRATLAAFLEMKGGRRGLVVLGDMLELGPSAAAAHEQAGREIGQMGFSHIFFLGEQAREAARGANSTFINGTRIHLPRSHEELLDKLGKVIEAGDWVLIKGSRRMRMEKIVAGLKERLGGV